MGLAEDEDSAAGKELPGVSGHLNAAAGQAEGVRIAGMALEWVVEEAAAAAAVEGGGEGEGDDGDQRWSEEDIPWEGGPEVEVGDRREGDVEGTWRDAVGGLGNPAGSGGLAEADRKTQPVAAVEKRDGKRRRMGVGGRREPGNPQWTFEEQTERKVPRGTGRMKNPGEEGESEGVERTATAGWGYRARGRMGQRGVEPLVQEAGAGEREEGEQGGGAERPAVV